MGRRGTVQDKKDNLIRNLKETTLSFEKLGERYGVSRQAIWDFFKRQGIKRPSKPRGHNTDKCRLCQKLIKISNKPHSEFISIHTIVKRMGRSRAECRYHVRRLIEQGLVGQRFGRFRSETVEKAYEIYFTEKLSIRAIGRRVGLRNFLSIIRRHRELGWNVPPSLYDKWRRSRIQSEMHRRKKR